MGARPLLLRGRWAPHPEFCRLLPRTLLPPWRARERPQHRQGHACAHKCAIVGRHQPAPGATMRHVKCFALLLALGVTHGEPSFAQEKLKIFDAHLHYNQEPTAFYPLASVLEVFRRNKVAGIIANSRPNTGTHELV